VKYRTGFSNTVRDAFKRRGWTDTDSDLDWNIIWADKEWISKRMDYVHLSVNQHVNHFRNHYELSRKDHLAKNIKKLKKKMIKENTLEDKDMFDFLPLTFNLPIDYSIFVEEFNKFQNQKQLWIMKPVNVILQLIVRLEELKEKEYFWLKNYQILSIGNMMGDPNT
jgi:tubulin polyglutamylase TTLL9